MRIAVYCEPLGVKTSGNPGRGMVKSLLRLRMQDEFVLVVRRDYQRSRELIEFLSELSQMTNWQLHVESRSRRLSNFLSLLRIRDYNRLHVSADVFINTDCTALGSNNHPLIITVADLSVLRDQSISSYKSRISYFLRKFLIRDGIWQADQIVAISKATRDDIMSVCPDKRENIHVIYNGIGSEWFQGAAVRCEMLTGLDNYWIWWGHISARKNLAGLMKAYALLKGRVDLPKIALVYSNPEFPSELATLISELKLTKCVISLKHLPREELIEAVSCSQGLLFPSFIEGFGLPIIEAMSRGVPVLTSSVSAMPEIAGNEAVLCNPHDVGDLARGLEKMLQPEMWTPENKERRKSRARLFSYEEAAKGYSRLIDKIYQSQLSGNRNQQR